jgi:type IVB pilus formation R64 PilN family outer membrane protein
MMRVIIRLLIILVALSFMTSCVESNKAFVNGNKNVDATQQNIDTTKTTNEAAPVVTTNSGFYADTKPIPIADNPAWLNNKISFAGKSLPLSFILQHILRNTDAILSYQPGVNTNKRITMSYTGTIKGALDNLAEKANYAYTINDKQINWSTFVTKSFDISFMPGSSDYMLGQTQAGTGTSNTIQRGDITTVMGAMNDEQYSSLKGTLSVWKDLEKNLNDLKSKDGTVDISEATTSVLVNDHPANVRAMERYINYLNQELSHQVELKVKILEVDLDKSHQYGIDWNLVAHALGTQFSITGSVFGNQQNITNLQGVSPVAFQIGSSDGSHVILNTLGLMGKVSVVTEPTVITLNNQVASIRITTDQSYLESSEASTTYDTVTTSITPGVVTSGFMLYILPKIQDDRVYLQLSSIISKLKSLDTINNLGGINTEVKPQRGNNRDITTIQIPTLDEKSFNMRSVVNNGATLVIGGFKQVENKTVETQVFDSPYLGGRGSRKHNVETVVLITPTIIENPGQ